MTDEEEILVGQTKSKGINVPKNKGERNRTKKSLQSVQIYV